MIHSTVLYLASALFAGGDASPADSRRAATPFHLASTNEPCVRADARVEEIPDGLAPRVESMWPKVSTEVAYRHEQGHVQAGEGASPRAALRPVSGARSKAPVLCLVRADGDRTFALLGAQ